VALEIDGGYHFTDDQRIYDEERQAVIESFGIEFLRFTNKQIENDIHQVLAKIYLKIGNKRRFPLTKGKTEN
jgi:very-short-patch-repair endonuclease